ncbi:hypothetical protein GOA69_16135 [Sinorhizobium meliloti]|uniref:hypothetical protein n=1 Tax=Rhizobium meliloti TaxID=382 RepID=UPI0012AA5990|nr:hypothetical protein [Sinorhizobium meliloti]MDW9473864.1 hypothetical protein [Sinorhizobium meliloti]QGJ74092.1 hypothetical protein C3L21_08740 [Sinorhizobium meliloti]
MISIFEQFLSRVGAINFLKDYRKRFPGTAYGTNLRINFNRMEQCWQVSGHRFNLPALNAVAAA